MDWNWQKIIYFIIGLLIGAILHEYMHGRIADWRGDHTARNAGRITLNPIPHIDPFGTVLMPITLLLLSRGTFTFAYAKPVPVNPFFLKKPRRDMMLVALSGPVTNFAVATVVTLVALVIRLIFNLSFYMDGMTISSTKGAVWANLFLLFGSVAVVNVMLGVFNLIPVPPLDGSHVVEYFLPPRARDAYEKVAPFGFLILILFLWLFGNFFYLVLEPLFRLIAAGVFGGDKSVWSVFIS